MKINDKILYILKTQFTYSTTEDKDEILARKIEELYKEEIERIVTLYTDVVEYDTDSLIKDLVKIIE